MSGPQGSASWMSARTGKLTASRMKSAMSFLKKGQESAERYALKVELLCERLTGDAFPHVVNDAMRWGTAYEPEAKAAYVATTFNRLTEVGFIDHPEIQMCGASPDALVGRDGLLECKCPTTAKHLTWILAGVVPEEHKAQMLLQMSTTRRKWCDFISYDPRVPPDQQVFIRRFEPSREEILQVEEHAVRFLGELEQMWDQLINTPAVA